MPSSFFSFYWKECDDAVKVSTMPEPQQARAQDNHLDVHIYKKRRPGDKSSVSMWLDTGPSNEQASHDPGLQSTDNNKPSP